MLLLSLVVIGIVFYFGREWLKEISGNLEFDKRFNETFMQLREQHPDLPSDDFVKLVDAAITKINRDLRKERGREYYHTPHEDFIELADNAVGGKRPLTKTMSSKCFWQNGNVSAWPGPSQLTKKAPHITDSVKQGTN